MPVFETGAFNHSATCPAASQVIGPKMVLQPARIVSMTPTRQRDARRGGIYRTGKSSRALEITVVEGSLLGVRYGLSTFDISRRILWLPATRQ